MSDLDRQKVREAIELLDYSSGIESTYVGSERDRRLEMLMQHFINEFPPAAGDLNISTSLLEAEIEDLLSESIRSTSPVDTFISRFGNLPAEIGSREVKDFQLGFPLNITNWPLGSKIHHQGHTFNKIGRGVWKTKYVDPIRTGSDFVSDFEEHPSSFHEEFTYWEVEYAARDPEYAIAAIERELEVVLGQMIYSILPWSHSNQFSHGNVWNRPWSELRPPFVYLIRGAAEYHDYYFDDDISPRESIHMFSDRKERVEFRYPQIPPLDPSATLEKKLLNAFRNFHSGATEPNRRRAFLDYWRAIEILCLFGNDENMTKITPRIRSAVPNQSNDPLFQDRLEEIKDKRNEYVHEHVDVEIAERDNRFLRQLFYELVPFFVINRNMDTEHVRIWLDNQLESLEHLNHEIQRKDSELKLFRKMRDSKTK